MEANHARYAMKANICLKMVLAHKVAQPTNTLFPTQLTVLHVHQIALTALVQPIA
jgi:hypothetical protein